MPNGTAPSGYERNEFGELVPIGATTGTSYLDALRNLATGSKIEAGGVTDLLEGADDKSGLTAAGLGGAIGRAGAGIASILGFGGEGGEPALQEAVDIWRKLELSDFDFSELTPPELRVVATMMPEVYEAIVPEEVKTIEGSPEARAAQLRALAGLERVAEEGLPIEDQLATQEATRAVADEAQRARLDAMRALAQRGQLGAGEEIQARLAGTQQASELARGAGVDVARDAALRRLAAMGAAGEAASGLRQADVAEQAANAEMINRFNEIVSQMQTQAARDAAAARQAAQAYNVGTRQRVAERNPILEYQTARENLERQNELRRQLFQQGVQKAQGLTGALRRKGAYAEQEKQRKIKGFGDVLGGAGTAIGGVFGGL